MTTVLFYSGYSFSSSCCISYQLAVGLPGWEHKPWPSLGFWNHWILNICDRNIFHISSIKIQKCLFSLIWLESRCHLLPKDVIIKRILHCLSGVQHVATRTQMPLDFHLSTDTVMHVVFVITPHSFPDMQGPNYSGNVTFLLHIRICRAHKRSVKISLFPAVQVWQTYRQLSQQTERVRKSCLAFT